MTGVQTCALPISADDTRSASVGVLGAGNDHHAGIGVYSGGRDKESVVRRAAILNGSAQGERTSREGSDASARVQNECSSPGGADIVGRLETAGIADAVAGDRKGFAETEGRVGSIEPQAGIRADNDLIAIAQGTRVVDAQKRCAAGANPRHATVAVRSREDNAIGVGGTGGIRDRQPCAREIRADRRACRAADHTVRQCQRVSAARDRVT